MAKALDGIVLENDLFREYEAFQQGGSYNKDLIRSIFCYMKGGKVVRSLSQYEAIDSKPTRELEIQLRKKKLVSQTVEQLAAMTPYKIILSASRTDFPYVNVCSGEEKIENNLGASFHRGESRQKAIQHIRALCANARDISVYDRFLSGGNESKTRSNLNMLSQLFPHKPLNIVCLGINDQAADYLRRQCDEWHVSNPSDAQVLHDRYITIDNSVEILLSSGIDHLVSSDQDFTYVVRMI